LIELNTNPALLNAPDLLSLLPMFEAPVESTNSSAPIAQDFSALLTELIGPTELQGLPDTAASMQVSPLSASAAIVPEMQAPAPNVPEVKLPVVIAPELSTPEVKTSEIKTPALEISVPEVKTPEVKVPEVKVPELNPESTVLEPKAIEARTPEVKIPEPKVPEVKVPQVKTPEPKVPEVKIPEPQAPEANGQSAEIPEAAPLTEPPTTKEIVPGKPREKEPKAQENENCSVVTPVPVALVAVPSTMVAAENPAVKIEEPVAEKPVQVPATQVPARSEMDPVWEQVKKFELNVKRESTAPAKSQSAEPGAPAEAPKQAMITSDPLANIRQEQLPPRIIAIHRVDVEARMPERSKSDPASEVSETTTAPTLHFNEVSQQVAHVEQVRPAHYVELPVVPQSQVVRTVAIEVGEADSQVIIRIQERSGDVSVQLNAASEPLRHNLQQSLGSLVHSLRQEEVKVASAEVAKRSPIEKVRRSKEAH